MMIDVDGFKVELTPREGEVLKMLQDPRGLTYRQIGDELGVSWCTIRAHAHLVYEKLGVGGPGARVRIMGVEGR